MEAGASPEELKNYSQHAGDPENKNTKGDGEKMKTNTEKNTLNGIILEYKKEDINIGIPFERVIDGLIAEAPISAISAESGWPEKTISKLRSVINDGFREKKRYELCI